MVSARPGRDSAADGIVVLRSGSPILVSYNAARMRELKSDLFGRVALDGHGGRDFIVRDTVPAPWWTGWIARHLCRREARALAQLDGLPGTPRLLESGRWALKREWIEGRPMQVARPHQADYYRAARALVARLHRRGVAHNDLAKEPNWLVTPRGQPAVVDFQLAFVGLRRGFFFRALAREDLRHLLKHKRRYCPDRLTARERRILATPAPLSRLWMAAIKPGYNFLTRRIFRWADREGAGDRAL